MKYWYTSAKQYSIIQSNQLHVSTYNKATIMQNMGTTNVKTTAVYEIRYVTCDVNWKSSDMDFNSFMNWWLK
jgi:hypothetical protein